MTSAVETMDVADSHVGADGQSRNRGILIGFAVIACFWSTGMLDSWSPGTWDEPLVTTIVPAPVAPSSPRPPDEPAEGLFGRVDAPSLQSLPPELSPLTPSSALPPVAFSARCIRRASECAKAWAHGIEIGYPSGVPSFHWDRVAQQCGARPESTPLNAEWNDASFDDWGIDFYGDSILRDMVNAVMFTASQSTRRGDVATLTKAMANKHLPMMPVSFERPKVDGVSQLHLRFMFAHSMERQLWVASNLSDVGTTAWVYPPSDGNSTSTVVGRAWKSRIAEFTPTRRKIVALSLGIHVGELYVVKRNQTFADVRDELHAEVVAIVSLYATNPLVVAVVFVEQTIDCRRLADWFQFKKVSSTYKSWTTRCRQMVSFIESFTALWKEVASARGLLAPSLLREPTSGVRKARFQLPVDSLESEDVVKGGAETTPFVFLSSLSCEPVRGQLGCAAAATTCGCTTDGIHWIPPFLGVYDKVLRHVLGAVVDCVAR